MTQNTVASVQAEFNAAINFALEGADQEGMLFLTMWREGDWAGIAQEFPSFKRPEQAAVASEQPSGYPSHSVIGQLIARHSGEPGFVEPLDGKNTYSVTAVEMVTKTYQIKANSEEQANERVCQVFSAAEDGVPEERELSVVSVIRNKPARKPGL